MTTKAERRRCLRFGFWVNDAGLAIGGTIMLADVMHFTAGKTSASMDIEEGAAKKMRVGIADFVEHAGEPLEEGRVHLFRVGFQEQENGYLSVYSESGHGDKPEIGLGQTKPRFARIDLDVDGAKRLDGWLSSFLSTPGGAQ